MWCFGLVLFLLPFVSSFDDFVDCGGFVSISPQLQTYIEQNNIKLDFSKDVHVHLMTTDGNTKFSADCAPNGYYIIPVYETGTFVLKIEGPAGWVFSPSQASVAVTKGDLCSQDFTLTGFSVLGRVSSEDRCTSSKKSVPKGIKLKLSSLSAPDSKPQEIESSSDGSFAFSNTFPGEYLIEASHPEHTLKNHKGLFAHEWGNYVLPDPFVVYGYGIAGRVLETSEHGEPVQSVSFFLYSEEENPPALSCPEPTNVPPHLKSKALCAVKTDESGFFKFSSVPCGKYTLVPLYISAHTTYDVIPKELKIEIDQDTFVIDSPFLVKGFSVKGHVVGTNSEGIEGVTVTATSDGTTRSAITDATGQYILDQITSGEYAITAEKPHYLFSSLARFKISPSLAVITDIVASRFHVCGKVSIPLPPPGVSIENRKIVMKPTDKATPPLNTKTDQTGAYCLAALPGKYSIAPEIDGAETAAGLLLTENSFEVTVENAPVLDVNFEQARLTVSGRVRCIESPCDTSISVTLSAIGRASKVTTGLAIGHDSSSGEDHFIFKGVLPGKYEVTINNENWCWEKESETIEIQTRDHSDIQFIQTGFVLLVRSSHDLDLKDKEDKTYKLVKGKNTFCLPKPGVYTFTPVSCYKFDTDTFVYDSTKPSTLKFNAIFYQIQSEIHIPDNVQLPAGSQISVNVTTNDVLRVVPAEKISNNLYSVTVWAELGQTLTITPSSNELFFYPQSQSTSVDRSECLPSLPPFAGRPGIYLTGTITPAFEGVLITVLFKETGLPALPTIKSDTKGHYSAGPLYDDRKYSIHAEKPGFYLKPVYATPGNFLAQKLGRVDVTVMHDGLPLPGVLLSLSGTEGYKNNNATDATGTFEFRNLFPGDYYLRPIFKEYTFSPSSQPITIKEGEELKIQVGATRVAYSVFGKVRSLSGEPEKLVGVEAVGEGLYEETQTDNSGNFRLRGLYPNKEYSLRVKLNKNSLIGRSEPQQIPVLLSNADIENMEFIVFSKNTKYDITGTVNAEKELLSSLSVQLFLNAEEKPLFEQSLAPINYFSFSGLDGEADYIVKLKTDLSEKQYNITTSQVKVSSLAELPSPHQIVLSFNANEKKIETSVENGSFGPILIAVFLAIALFNYQYILDLYKKYTSPQPKVDSNWLSDINHLKKKKKVN
uniref:ER membrane protein complex subunit 7 beta-sandwich domain-containing protein n=1 Tax=Arcella intermedia TaxID=1963864 RepID=A0A6B2KWV3_9EUKA